MRLVLFPPQSLFLFAPLTYPTTRSLQRPAWCSRSSRRPEVSSAESTSATRRDRSDARCSTKVKLCVTCSCTAGLWTRSAAFSVSWFYQLFVSRHLWKQDGKAHMNILLSVASLRRSFSFTEASDVTEVRLISSPLCLQISTRGRRCSSTGYLGRVTATSPSS